MYLAKYNNQMIIISKNKYAILEQISIFNWGNFSWKHLNLEFNNKKTDILSELVECPVSPSKIIRVGRNYVEHAKELANVVPNKLLLFIKPNSCLIGHHGEIKIPLMSQRIEHEIELVAVIGRKAKTLIKKKH